MATEVHWLIYDITFHDLILLLHGHQALISLQKFSPPDGKFDIFHINFNERIFIMSLDYYETISITLYFIIL